jgi:probable addiction module antidote protein
MIETTVYRTEDYLETSEDVAAYLEAVFEDGDPQLICAALGNIARSKGMTEIARRAGRGRTSMYKALCQGGHPEFATVVDVIRALDLQLTVTPKRRPEPVVGR